MPSNETIAIVLSALIFNALGSVLFKMGAGQRTARRHSSRIGSTLAFVRDMLSNKKILLGLLLQIGAIIGWLAFMSRMALSFAFPMSSISNVTILLASHFILHEQVSPRRWWGVLLILVGITIIANT